MRQQCQQLLLVTMGYTSAFSCQWYHPLLVGIVNTATSGPELNEHDAHN